MHNLIFALIISAERGVSVELVIRAEGLKKYFGQLKAVDDVSFQVEKGELFGFLGVNGAGKSTVINMLCTLYQPDAGSIEICGFMAGKDDNEIRKRIGVVYQNNCLDDKLTVKENLFIRGALYEKNRRRLTENIEKICGILELKEVYGRRFAGLSGGQKRRCEIARALLNEPEIMFLDEPTTGLDPAARKNVWECLERLRRENNMTVFLTTHYMEEAARASHISVMDSGRLKEYGTPFDLKEMYAKDRLILYSSSCELEELLDKMRVEYKKKDDRFVVSVSKSKEALPILTKTVGWINGFEVIQGSMDDVFLNITGRNLEEI
ncbi:MAG: ABC transporter ATP-binding protein [Firmicutes bacterium]|nr:ABC transporter ATP-binding protein [Bacillota bacterium]